ncbi:unnamed protein product [Effrenium voratum]|uniref:CRAL-TRIO domain-containing protein n=1 Tax=Effrenium voratum TaxID=2562239 RepID=A0AA36MIX3_9DINO|nr:unnamed protein product [Effrenium voratum]
MGASLGGVANGVCCTTRGDEAAVRLERNRHHSWQELPDADEFQAFFDCYETHDAAGTEQLRNSLEMQRVNSGPRRFPLERRGSGDLGLVPEAVPMLMKAIECRVRERELFQCMRCKVACDMRIIGRDRENRPAIYMSARSQTEPLRLLIPQVFLAFEAASRLAQEDGQAILVADMVQLQTHLNMDPFAFKDLANNFGVVFADRLKCILIVDFSFIAQAFWATVRPFLSERTQKKINFVSEAKARQFVKENFFGPTRDRILSSFDINRDELSTQEDRFAHALRTAICDVPLGELRAPDEAG